MDGMGLVDHILKTVMTTRACPVLESMRAREPGLQAPSNLAGSKIKNTHFFPYNFFLRDVISNIGKSNNHVICLFSEGKAINSKMI